MKSFLQFLSESDSSSESSTAIDRLLDRLKGTKLVDPDTGLPQPLYRGTSAAPNFDFAEMGKISNKSGSNTWGPGQYWSTSPSYAERYMRVIPNITQIKQPWYLRPFKSPTTKTTYSYAPGSRIITGYANIENPIEMRYGANIQHVGERLGIPTPNVNDRHNPNYLAQINDALNKRGIDAIKAYDKHAGELVPHEIWNIRDPKKVILSPHVLTPPTTPKPPKSSRLPGVLGVGLAALSLASGARAEDVITGLMDPISTPFDRSAGLGSDKLDTTDYDKYYDKQGRPRRSAWPADSVDVNTGKPITNWSPEK